MAADLRRVFGDRFVALVASEHGAAAFLTALRADDLDALGSLAEPWHREGLATPLVMTPDEFRRSLDTFPAEYQALLDHHVVIDGAPPFDGVRINPDDLRRACEVQARGHLIHLRQGWIESAGHAHGLEELLQRSAGPLRQLLTNLAQLHGEDPEGDGALAAFAQRLAGMPEPLVASVLKLDRAPHEAKGLVPRMADYLAASERLWAFIDAWRAQ